MFSEVTAATHCMTCSVSTLTRRGLCGTHTCQFLLLTRPTMCDTPEGPSSVSTGLPDTWAGEC